MTYPIFLKNLTLTNFRSYPYLTLDFESKFVVFNGPNGAGKTNILEAISFLNPGRGLRRAKLSELSTHVEKQSELPYSFNNAWTISAKIDLPFGECQIGTALMGTSQNDQENERRIVRVDGRDLNSQAELEKILSIIWITPSMDKLLSEGPAQRRRLLDKFTSSLDSDHSKRLYRYDYALRERSKLLRDGKKDASWLGTLEETLALEGVSITVARQDLVEVLMASQNVQESSFPKAFLSLEGEIEDLLKTYSALDTEELLKQKLKQARIKDSEMGGASIGSHLSDMKVSFSEKELKLDFCSTGEQKALLISMILAHVRVHSLRRKESPLLLLDEGVVHLDLGRRRAFFEELKDLNPQVFFTGTEISAFQDLKRYAQFFDVDDGCARRIN